jgi:hypothetical protein
MTLEVLRSAWVDPYASVEGVRREEIAREVGLFVKETTSIGTPLGDLIGRTLNGVEGIFSEMNELVGVTLDFGTLRVRATEFEVDLIVVVT